MGSVNLLSHLKTNWKQSVSFSTPITKNTLKPPVAPVAGARRWRLEPAAAQAFPAAPAQEESVLLLSQKAKKLIEEKKEAEKKKMQEAEKLLEEKKEAERQKIKEARDKLNGTSALEETKNAKRRALGEKIQEIKRRVKALLEMMRGALLFDDKRAAALIAKEVAELAKQLKKLLAESDNSGGESASVPDVDISGESAESSAPDEPAEGAENINGEEVIAGAETEAAVSQAQELQEAHEAQNGTGEVKAAKEGQEAEQAEQSERSEKAEKAEREQEEKRKVSQAANDLQAMARNLIAKYESGFGNDAAMQQEIREIVAMMKTILSMAKQTVKQKTGALNNAQGKPYMEVFAQAKEAEAAKAEKEVEEAIRSFEGTNLG